MRGPLVPLTGADCFLRAFDGEVRRTAGASHLSQLVLRLGPGFEPERLRALVADVAAEAPIVRAPIRRPRIAGAPVYDLARAARAPLPRVVVHAPAPPARGGEARPLPEAFFAALNARLDARRGELLRFDVVPAADGAATDLALTWVHMLFDGSGSEAFVRWLDERASGKRAPGELPAGDGLGDVAPPPLGAGRGREAQAWRRHMNGMAAAPPRSLAGPLRRVQQALRYDVDTFSPDETAAVAERARQKAGFLTPMLYYLAAAIRAHAAVFRARGVEPRSFVVPLPVNLRPKGGEGAVFRTHVSMLWFHAPADATDDPDALLELLKQQRRDAIKAGLVEAGVAAMDYARFAPAPLYAHMARRSFRGELCSFFFAWTDQF
ncbi:MAG TPA: hypothetical protein VHQ66_11855, partial [Myxococcota bacterium]|nr:hypothetical protein [Myxococcota bacterium]